MSINFYKTILLVVFCLSFLSPIKLQAYCQFEGCGVSSNVDEAPLTLQEAQEIKEFYTSVERDLSENVEVLSDGTYQVTFNQNIAMGIGAVAGSYRVKLTTGSRSPFPPKWHNDTGKEAWLQRGEAWKKQNDVLKYHAERFPGLREVLEGDAIVEVNFINSNYTHKVSIERSRNFDNISTSRIVVYQEREGAWLRGSRVIPIDFKDGIEANRTINQILNALKEDSGAVLENYLQKRNITFGSAVVVKKAVRAVRFVGRWSLRAVLATAGIVGSHLAYDYAQENHPEETGLIIAITKEQFEILSTNVRGIIEDLSGNNDLNELEL